jgi:Ca2+/Na+ antiporter
MLMTLDWLASSILALQTAASSQASAVSPWWTTQTSIWIGALGGSGVGLLGAILGPAMGILIPKGKGKAFILPSLLVMAIVGGCMELVGIAAVIQQQPYHVWYPLVLLGAICLCVMLPLYFVAKARYRALEVNRMEARDLLTGH